MPARCTPDGRGTSNTKQLPCHLLEKRKSHGQSRAIDGAGRAAGFTNVVSKRTLWAHCGRKTGARGWCVHGAGAAPVHESAG